MQKTKTIEKIYEILREHLEVSKISPNMSLKDELALDSLDMVELSIKFENEFGIDPEITDGISFDSVQTVYDLICVITAAMDLPAPQKTKKLPYTLHEERKYKIYCRLTDKKCKKIRGFNPGEDPCLASKCKLAQRFADIVQKQR